MRRHPKACGGRFPERQRMATRGDDHRPSGNHVIPQKSADGPICLSGGTPTTKGTVLKQDAVGKKAEIHDETTLLR